VLVSELCSFLETCDAARYAPSALDDLSVADAAARVRAWIKQIERTTR
jgi:hypothetical protein